MSIVMTYTVHPPQGANIPDDIPTSRTLEVPVISSENATAYYGVLHEALAEARNKIGADLTVWRDAVGKLELVKETKRAKNAEDEEDDDEEGDEND